MTHRFPIKEIARQAGLGTATVDRALNGRPHVSPQTRNRVAAAIRELEAQESLLTARGRKLFLDIVVEAPRRFTREVRAAAEAALAQVAGAVIRTRFYFQEVMSEEEVVANLERIRRRGSQGVCVKVRDTPAIRATIDGLVASGIPIFTLVTDLPNTARTAYFGMDNVNAGRTAAYLLAQALPRPDATVLTVRSRDEFLGEAERHDAFRAELAALRPNCRIVGVSGGAGLPGETKLQVSRILRSEGRVDGVYSIGGGNAAILETLADFRNEGVPFVAHDLDWENVGFLRNNAISFVLSHDLTHDMRTLYAALTASHGLASWDHPSFSSDVRIVSPYNIPDTPYADF